jgi:hypothetical protein
MAEPVLANAPPQTNTYGEHVYKARVTLGASTAFTYRGALGITVARPTATTLTITLPKAYAEITDFHVGRQAAAAVAGLEYIITSNLVATTGVITLTSIVAAGTATAGASGDVLYITLGVSSDVLNDRFTG